MTRTLVRQAGPVESLLDPEALSRLKRMGGTKLVRRMVGLFMQHAGKHVESLRTTRGCASHSQVKMAAHSLKTSAGILGARRLLQVATDTESAATNEETKRVRVLTAELCSEYDRTAKHLTHLLVDL